MERLAFELELELEDSMEFRSLIGFEVDGFDFLRWSGFDLS